MALCENAALTPFPRNDITVERKGGKHTPLALNRSSSSLSNSSLPSFDASSNDEIRTPNATTLHRSVDRHSPPVRDLSTPMPVHDFMRNFEIQIPTTVGYLPQSGANITDMEKRIAFLEGKLASLMADMNENLKTQSDKTVEISQLKEDLSKAQKEHPANVQSDGILSSQQMALEHQALLAQVTEFKLRVQEDVGSKYSLEQRVKECQSLEETLRGDLKRLTLSLENKQLEYDKLQASVNAVNQQLQTQEETQFSFQRQHEQLISETEALRKQTEWYHSQLDEAVVSREALSRKYDEISQHLLQAALDKENLGMENSSLKVALWDLKETVIDGKKKLIEQLQEIEEGMQLKDHQLSVLETERGRLSQLLQDHKQQLEESKKQVITATNHSYNLQTNLVEQQRELEERAAQLNILVSEKSYLLENLQQLKEEINLRDAQFEARCAEYNHQADELRKSTMTCEEMTVRMESLNLEKVELESNLNEHIKLKKHMEETIDVLQRKVSSSDVTFQELNQRIEDSVRQLEFFQTQNVSLSHEVEDVKYQMASKEQTITLLHQQFNELTLVKAKLAEENMLLSGELTSLRSRLEGAEMKVSSALHENLILEESGRQKDTALATSNAELQCVKQDLATLRVELVHYSEQCDKYQQRIVQLEQLQGEVTSLQELLKEAHSEKERIVQHLDASQVANEELAVLLERRVDEYENQVAELRNTEGLLYTRLQALESSRDVEVKQHVTQHAEVLNKLSEQLRSLEKERDELQQYNGTLGQRLTETNSQLHSNGVISERRMQELQQRCATFEQYAQQCRQLEVSLHQAYGQISGLQDYVHMLKTTATSVEEKLANREAELHRLRIDSERHVNGAKGEVEGLSLQCGNLQSTLESERQLKNALQSAVEHLQKKHNEVAQQLREKNNHLNAMMHSVDDKERQLVTWKTQRDAMEQRMEELKKQVILEKQQRGAVLLEKRQIELEKNHLEERYSHLRTQLENANNSLIQEREAVRSLHARLEAQRNIQQETVQKLTEALENKGNTELALTEEVGRLKMNNGQLNRELYHMKVALQRVVETYQSPNEVEASSSQQLLTRVRELSNSAPLSPAIQLTSWPSALQKCIAGLRQEVDELQSQSQVALSALGSSRQHAQVGLR